MNGSSFSSYLDLPLVANPSFSTTGYVSINDNGLIAYSGVYGGYLDPNYSPVTTGLFVGPNLANKVIGRGDSFFGSTVTDFEFYEGGLHNNGSLAFAANLADGRQLIVRADPDSQSVPEPSTILGVAIASVEDFIKDLPEEELDKIPTDRVLQHDHYLY